MTINIVLRRKWAKQVKTRFCQLPNRLFPQSWALSVSQQLQVACLYLVLCVLWATWYETLLNAQLFSTWKEHSMKRQTLCDGNVCYIFDIISNIVCPAEQPHVVEAVLSHSRGLGTRMVFKVSSNLAHFVSLRLHYQTGEQTILKFF